MKMGLRSLLFGAHQFILHPIMVAIAWIQLYGGNTVKDPYVGEVSIFDVRLWIAFIIHDWGYYDCEKMDDRRGEMHPIWGAARMEQMFGEKWSMFTLYHSRFLAKQEDMPFSLLCVADKYSTVIEPAWLYLPRVKLSGEIKEYMDLACDPNSKYKGEVQLEVTTEQEWHHNLVTYMRNWVERNKHGDTKEVPNAGWF